ncbi:LysR family transcriptional regulator [Herbaspirillum sp. GCM10030257]|uniref:LysR family transcriptional regulator n=1 Tax=Herbaspirillum sp. GCM10030257 TaxID=3273393 RepID=UPI00361641E8
MKSTGFDWNDLKFFLAVARSGSLSGAAAALCTSASTVSRHVDALEKRFGRTLFLRQQSGYLLTDEGVELIEQVEQVEQAMMATERKGHRSAQQEVSGIVKLATTEMLASHLVVPHLHKLRARHPKLRIELDVALARVNLSRREADLALRMVAPNEGEADYIARRIGKIDFDVYCASSAMPANDGEDQPDGWRGRDYFSWGGNWDELPMAKWMRSTFSDKPPAIVCNSLLTQYAAVRAGLGLGMLPCFIGDGDSGLCRVSRDAIPVSRDLWLMYHRDMKASRRVVAVQDFIKELAETHLQAS